jgi:hypothetical protein
MMHKLSPSEVRAVTGLTERQLDEWSFAWLGGEARGGQGHGNHRRYDTSQTFALFAAKIWRNEEAGKKRTDQLISFLGRVPVEHLEQEFSAGRTVPIMACLPYLFNELLVPVSVCGVSEPDQIKRFAGGYFVRPDTEGLTSGARALLDRVDLGRLWKQFQERLKEVTSRVKKGRGHRVLR